MARIQTNDRADGLESDQAFTLDIVDPIYDEKRRSIVDANPFFTWRESFDLRGFVDGQLWKHAVFECLGTGILVWFTGLATYSVAPTVM
jgi:hypothetical protein